MKTMTMKSIKQYKFSLLHIFIICLSIPGMLGVVSVLSGCEDENTGDFVKGDTGYLTFQYLDILSFRHVQGRLQLRNRKWRTCTCFSLMRKWQ